jgi:translation initiation factor 3 subunit B
MFIEYSDPNSATEAVRSLDGYKFDKNHTLLVNLFTDFDKYENISDEWKKPEPQQYKDAGNLWNYLLEPDAFDQYLIVKLGVTKVNSGLMASNDVQVWLNSAPEPTEVLIRQGGTDTVAKWSPLGTYMASFHSKGVAVWGGEKFDKINRFAHINAEFIDFSPNER